jgi:hypothetical protein
MEETKDTSYICCIISYPNLQDGNTGDTKPSVDDYSLEEFSRCGGKADEKFAANGGVLRRTGRIATGSVIERGIDPDGLSMKPGRCERLPRHLQSHAVD